MEFRALRFDTAHHLGMGDIRLTIGQQEEIEAEISALQTDKESLLVGRDYLLSEIEKLKSERDAAELMSLALRAELAECQQDAERYRWLRGTVPESSSRWARWRLECWISGAWHELRGLHLDTCIDAARKGEGE